MTQQITSYKNDDININLNGKIQFLKDSIYDIDIDKYEIFSYSFDTLGNPNTIYKMVVYLDTNFSDYNKTTSFSFKNGNLISKIDSGNNDINSLKTTFDYDINENVVSIRNYLYNNLVSADSIDYDEKNRLIKFSKYAYAYYQRQDIFFSDNSKYISYFETFQYDNSDNIILKTMNNIRNNVYHKYIYKYDENNNLIEEGSCNNYKGDYNETKCYYQPLVGYEYNEAGQKKRKFQFGNWSPHNTEEFFEYDENGKEIGVKGYYISTDTVLGFYITYQYDNYGNKIREEENTSNYKYNYKIGYYKYFINKYDDKQNIVATIFYSPNDEVINITEYIYIYDDFGNWIKKEEYIGEKENKLSKTLEQNRIIKYY